VRLSLSALFHIPYKHEFDSWNAFVYCFPTRCDDDACPGRVFLRAAVVRLRHVALRHVCLQDIEERVMIIRDQVLTRTCQLYYDYFGPHNRDLYGEAHKH
jgi:hypothetical protein